MRWYSGSTPAKIVERACNGAKIVVWMINKSVYDFKTVRDLSLGLLRQSGRFGIEK